MLYIFRRLSFVLQPRLRCIHWLPVDFDIPGIVVLTNACTQSLVPKCCTIPLGYSNFSIVWLRDPTFLNSIIRHLCDLRGAVQQKSYKCKTSEAKIFTSVIQRHHNCVPMSDSVAIIDQQVFHDSRKRRHFYSLPYHSNFKLTGVDKRAHLRAT